MGIQIFKIITFFASWEFIALASLLVLIVFYLNNETYLYLPYIFVVAGTEIAIFSLKALFVRPRFINSVIETTTASFPSAHAAIALAFYGYLAYVMIKYHEISKGWLIITASCLIIVLIGVSRLYLGAHYLSDVIGAYIISSIFLVSGIYISNKRRKNTIKSFY